LGASIKTKSVQLVNQKPFNVTNNINQSTNSALSMGSVVADRRSKAANNQSLKINSSNE
jgi:hypothetical protein